MSIELKTARKGAAGYMGAVAGAVLLVGATSGAQAAPYAYGALNFTGVSLTGVVTPGGQPVAGVIVRGARVITNSSAVYDVLPPDGATRQGNLATGSDVRQSFSGTSGAPGQNNFGQALLGGSATRGDARIAGPITGATADVVAEGRLTAVPSSASSTAGTNTSITIRISVAATTAVSLSFTATNTLIATTDSAFENSSVNSTASFSITQGATQVAFFSPGALNQTVSSNTGDDDSSFSSGPTAYSTGPFTLGPGDYVITLASSVLEQLSTTTPPPPVPEPASMALLGMGLLGLGLVRNRRKAV